MTTKEQTGRARRSVPQRRQAGAKPPGVRNRILESALHILRESGIQHLTQGQVAQRAGVRQSHLTYYFATRDDLLEAVTERAVEGLASGLRTVIGNGKRETRRRVLERLARSVAGREHMRMFVAMIVEGDEEPAVRKLLTRGTERMEAAGAAALGGDGARERARVILAAVWGLGLYQFLIRPEPKSDPTRAFLSWLGTAAATKEH